MVNKVRYVFGHTPTHTHTHPHTQALSETHQPPPGASWRAWRPRGRPNAPGTAPSCIAEEAESVCRRCRGCSVAGVSRSLTLSQRGGSKSSFPFRHSCGTERLIKCLSFCEKDPSQQERPNPTDFQMTPGSLLCILFTWPAFPITSQDGHILLPSRLKPAGDWRMGQGPRCQSQGPPLSTHSLENTM